MDVLPNMLVTAAVFHLERSALNADALENAVEIKAMVDPIQKQVEKKKNEEMGKGEKTKFEKEETTNKRTKMCSGRT